MVALVVVKEGGRPSPLELAFNCWLLRICTPLPRCPFLFPGFSTADSFSPGFLTHPIRCFPTLRSVEAESQRRANATPAPAPIALSSGEGLQRLSRLKFALVHQRGLVRGWMKAGWCRDRGFSLGWVFLSPSYAGELLATARPRWRTGMAQRPMRLRVLDPKAASKKPEEGWGEVKVEELIRIHANIGAWYLIREIISSDPI